MAMGTVEQTGGLDLLTENGAPPQWKDASSFGGGRLLWKQMHLNGSVGLDSGNVSLLQRVDRLDNILAVMEDKVPGEQSSCASSSPRGSGQQPCWSGPPTPSSLEKRCKATAAVLEEVEEKGTLVERVSDLEKRISKMMSTTKSVNGDIPAVDSTAEHSESPAEDQKSIQDGGKCEVLAIVTTITEHRATRSEEGLKYSAMSDGAASEHEQKTTPRQRLKTRSKRIKKWLSKRLHLSFPSTENAAQVEAH